MYTPLAYAFAYAIKQTPYAFVAKIIPCMYLLYDVVFELFRTRVSRFHVLSRTSTVLPIFVDNKVS